MDLVPTYPISLLARQLELLQDRFLPQHPYAWLVWEPEVWGGTRDSLSATVKDFAREPRESHPSAQDPLCFELTTGASMLCLGRSRESDLFVPDATVSRKHLALRWDAGWSVQPWRQTWQSDSLNGIPLEPTRWVRLSPGDRVKLGAAAFVFLDTGGLIDRFSKPQLH